MKAAAAQALRGWSWWPPRMFGRRDWEVTGPTAAGRAVRIPVRGAELQGRLAVPVDARGFVVLALDGAAAEPGLQSLAAAFFRAGLATAVVDLSSRPETPVRPPSRSLDPALLVTRLVEVTDWARGRAGGLQVGLFGAGRAGAAAISAGVERPGVVRAIVSCAGRIDLADDALPHVRAPTLLVVGAHDDAGVRMSRAGMRVMPAETAVLTIPRTVNPLSDDRALKHLTAPACHWLAGHLGPNSAARGS